jgi:hypothetical protein
VCDETKFIIITIVIIIMMHFMRQGIWPAWRNNYEASLVEYSIQRYRLSKSSWFTNLYYYCIEL